MATKQKPVVAVYGCGGTGINITRLVETGDITKFSGDFTCYYVDTSDSNVRDGAQIENLFQIEGVDGAGKRRSGAYEAINRHAGSIVSKFPAGTFNIIVASASGGSGAVIAQVIANQLIAKNENFVIVYIGSVSSHAEIKNTSMALKSLEILGNKNSRPIVLHYLSNNGVRRSDIDHQALMAIRMLIGLFNPIHDELDSADIKSWLTDGSLGNRLVTLHFNEDPKNHINIQGALSVVTLAVDGANTDLEPKPAYQAVGFIPKQWVEAKILDATGVVHYVIGDAVVFDEVKRLEEEADAVQAEIQASQRRDSLVSKSDQAGDDGLIL